MRTILGLLSLILMFTSIMLSLELEGYSLGDELLHSLGINAWSEYYDYLFQQNFGLGFHYTAIIGIFCSVICYFITKHLLKNTYPKLVKNLHWYLLFFILLANPVFQLVYNLIVD